MMISNWLKIMFWQTHKKKVFKDLFYHKGTKSLDWSDFCPMFLTLRHLSTLNHRIIFKKLDFGFFVPKSVYTESTKNKSKNSFAWQRTSAHLIKTFNRFVHKINFRDYSILMNNFFIPFLSCCKVDIFHRYH